MKTIVFSSLWVYFWFLHIFSQCQNLAKQMSRIKNFDIFLPMLRFLCNLKCPRTLKNVPRHDRIVCSQLSRTPYPKFLHVIRNIYCLTWEFVCKGEGEQFFPVLETIIIATFAGVLFTQYTPLNHSESALQSLPKSPPPYPRYTFPDWPLPRGGHRI